MLANAPAQWPTPPVKSGYNGVFCTDSGVDIVKQNFLPLNIGTPSVLQSTDTSESTINIITKGINFTNAIDNTNQLIMMAAVEDMLITLGWFKGSGYTFIDLISDIIGVGMKSMFLSNAILNSLDDGVDLDKILNMNL